MMKVIFSMALVCGVAGTTFSATPGDMVQKIKWYGQSSIRIEAGGKVIWIDPVAIRTEEKADIILITHSHGDHYSQSDIKKLTGSSTVLITSFDSGGLNLNSISDKTTNIGPVKIEGVPAYNIKKTQFHPLSDHWMGYLITVESVKIYHAGDTERIPEMKNFSCDIALIPLGQTYTMNNVEDAVDSVLDVKAKIALPIHFGLYEGTEKDADTFVSLLSAKGVQAFKMKKQ
jgi:L-ascorbate metabolism protein UlaG (beta-lactamase superfamily)